MGLFSSKKKINPNPRDRRRMMRLPEDKAMLVLNDVSYAIADWSIEGFRAVGYRGGLARNDEARSRLIIMHRGRPIGFDARTRVIREDSERGEIAGEFVTMSKAARKDIARVYRERLAMKQAALGITDENVSQIALTAMATAEAAE